MTAMHFYGWEQGLKTGQYYFRSRPARDAIKFTVNMEALLAAADKKVDGQDKDQILQALEKVDKLASGKKSKQAPQETPVASTLAVNLGRKTAQPRGGYSEVQ
jgi:hypothetical protein